MATLRTVDVATIQPNPWRDGRGAATWDSVTDTYTVHPGKINRLKASMLAGGVFEGGVIAREVPGGYELAFGHHRVIAFKALLAEGAIPDGFPLVVKALTDQEMLSYMTRENSEEDGHSWDAAVLIPIQAWVTAYGAGKLKDIPAPYKKTSKDNIRYAPAFTLGCDPNDGVAYPYTVTTVSDATGIERHKVEQGLDDLIAIVTDGILTRDKLAKDRDAVRVARLKARKAEKQKAADLANEKKARKDSAEAARLAGDKDKEAKETAAASNIEARTETSVKNAAKGAGDSVGVRISEGKTTAQGEERALDKPTPAPSVEKLPWDEVEKLTKALDKVGKETLKPWKDAKAFKGDDPRYYIRNTYAGKDPRGLEALARDNATDKRTRELADRLLPALIQAAEDAVKRLKNRIKEVSK